MKVWLIKPATDTRDGDDVIKSRIGLSATCRAIDKNEDVFEVFKAEAGDVDAIICDECQFFTAEQIITLFQKSQDVINIGAFALRFTSIGMIFMAFSVPVNMLYQSIRQPGISSFLSMLRSGAITLPILLIGVPIFGLPAIQLAQPIADMVAGLVSIPFILHFLKTSPKE